MTTRNVPKITPAGYPDLPAAVDAGTPQRELARRYGCASSLVARHVARAKRARGPREAARAVGLSADPHTGSMREILEARVRDPKTTARDLASLVNALARLDAEETAASDGELRIRLAPARQRIRELEAAQFQLPRFMEGSMSGSRRCPPTSRTGASCPARLSSSSTRAGGRTLCCPRTSGSSSSAWAGGRRPYLSLT